MSVVAVNGGKGGTGKTFIAINIAVYLQSQGYKVLLVDSDVENPNTNILLGIQNIEKEIVDEVRSVYQFIPEFDEDKCTKCQKCSQVCRTHAIFQITDNYPVLMSAMCSGCELCYKICPDEAIIAQKKEVGKIYYKKKAYSSPDSNGSLDIMVGVMNTGEVRAVKIIEAEFRFFTEELAHEEYDYIVLDQSPGAHCDVEFGLDNSDFAVSVTEPTPFGAHDLNRILELGSILEKKSYIVLNRYNLADYEDEILKIISNNKAELIGRIPLDQNILEAYAQGIPFLDYKKLPDGHSSKQQLRKIGEKVVALTGEKGDRNNDE